MCLKVVSLPLRYNPYMKRGLLILVPIIIFAVYMSRPVSLPAESSRGEVVKHEEVVKEEINLQIVPESVIQGEPVLVLVNGLGSTTRVTSLRFNNKPLDIFLYEGRPAALIGLDLRFAPGTYPLQATFYDAPAIQTKITVGKRVIATEPLGIPEKLGGNTPESEKELVNTLVEEGRIINAIKTSPEKLWSGGFRYPVAGPIVITDTYGYSRQTGGSSISHKGTDFRAKVGTPIYAMNSGKVAFTQYLRNYGNTIVLDHGLGLLTMYMHLSKISVTKGEMVEKGEMIGLSGDTGYVLGPHLHLTVRINNISIDPEKFIEILGER